MSHVRGSWALAKSCAFQDKSRASHLGTADATSWTSWARVALRQVRGASPTTWSFSEPAPIELPCESPCDDMSPLYWLLDPAERPERAEDAMDLARENDRLREGREGEAGGRGEDIRLYWETILVAISVHWIFHL